MSRLDRALRDRGLAPTDPQWFAARGITAGPGRAHGLLDAVEQELGIMASVDSSPQGAASQFIGDALDYLRRAPDPTITRRLLALAERGAPIWIARDVMRILMAMGRDAIDELIIAYGLSNDPSFKAFVTETLTGSRVTDWRILAICRDWLTTEPAFAADMFIDYGEPSVTWSLKRRLSDLRPTSPTHAEHILAVCAAIKSLGGTLTPREELRRGAAARHLVRGLRRHLRLLVPRDSAASSTIVEIANHVAWLGGALSESEARKRTAAEGYLETAPG